MSQCQKNVLLVSQVGSVQNWDKTVGSHSRVFHSVERLGNRDPEADQVKQRLNFEHSQSSYNSRPVNQNPPLLDYSPYIGQKRNLSPETKRIILEQQKVIEALHSQLADLQKKVNSLQSSRPCSNQGSSGFCSHHTCSNKSTNKSISDSNNRSKNSSNDSEKTKTPKSSGPDAQGKEEHLFKAFMEFLR